MVRNKISFFIWVYIKLIVAKDYINRLPNPVMMLFKPREDTLFYEFGKNLSRKKKRCHGFFRFTDSINNVYS